MRPELIVPEEYDSPIIRKAMNDETDLNLKQRFLAAIQTPDRYEALKLAKDVLVQHPNVWSEPYRELEYRLFPMTP